MRRFILIAMALLFVSLASAADTMAANPCNSTGFCVDLKKETAALVPGVEFLGLDADVGIGDILSGIYRFSLGLVGLAALIMLIMGGVMYMTARDSQDQTKRAYSFMSNAIWGLVIALLSWLALNTINPDMVKKLEFDNLPKIQKVVIPTGADYDHLRNSGLPPDVVAQAVNNITNTQKIKEECSGGTFQSVVLSGGRTNLLCTRDSDVRAVNGRCSDEGSIYNRGFGDFRCAKNFKILEPIKK